jgi:hypothetical protein
MRRCGVLFAACVSSSALGQFFAVAPGPRLVTIDPDTGSVAEVGPLVLNGNIASMEFVGQRLYATESRYPNGAALIEIDPASGAVLSRHEMTLDGAGLVNGVEGLGYDAASGTLVQGLWRPDSSGPAGSNTLGVLALDGVIGPVFSYGPGADFDGLAARGEDGSMYWVDREPGPNTVEIGAVAAGGARVSLALFGFDSTLNGVNDVALAPDRGELLAADGVTRRVHRFDPATAALLGSVAVSTDETMNLAAYRVACLADLAPPFGLLDLADVTAFVQAFLGEDPVADFADPAGQFDLADVLAFVGAFGSGCGG